MKCTNHPEVDATGTCVKCGKNLCIDCQRELHNKTYCQPCADEMRTQEAVVALTLVNRKNKEPNINFDKFRFNDKARYLKYLNIVAGLFLISGIGLTFALPLLLAFPLASTSEGQTTLDRMVSAGIAQAIIGIILIMVSMYFHIAISIGAKKAILLGIIIVIFGVVYIVKS
jgi:hypothetical protein